jgi:uncharacterized membrane protein YjjB (DUF3815 family)
MNDVRTVEDSAEEREEGRFLSLRAALVVCAITAMVGWVGVIGAVHLGRLAVASMRGTSSGPVISQIVPHPVIYTHIA